MPLLPILYYKIYFTLLCGVPFREWREKLCHLPPPPPPTHTHYEYDRQRKRTKYTVPQVDKGTSLLYYYVKMCRTGCTCTFTCSTHFYIIAVKGCSFVYLRNCIFCPLSLSVMFKVTHLHFGLMSHRSTEPWNDLWECPTPKNVIVGLVRELSV